MPARPHRRLIVARSGPVPYPALTQDSETKTVRVSRLLGQDLPE